jgi:hypothetical protein
MAGLAIGSVLTPILVGLAGAEGAVLGVALVLPGVALIAGRGLLTLDRGATVPVVELALLRSSPTFAALAAPELERLARSMKPLEVKAGETLLREGEPGDQAFLVADGELEVLVGDKPIATLGRGDLVGEIALLRGGMRTATVVSKTASLLFELDRETFMETLGGAHAIQHLVDARLGELGRIRA